jgi:hypothetical protein
LSDANRQETLNDVDPPQRCRMAQISPFLVRGCEV